MRQNTPAFDEFNQASNKELRLVIEIGYAVPLYFTSHSSIPNIPAGAIENVVRDVSSTSQRLVPDEGRAEIGSLSWSLVDWNQSVSNAIAAKETGGEGINGKQVRLYRGGAGMDWSNFRLEQTLQIDKDIQTKGTSFLFSASDIQRAMRKDIFPLARTFLRAAFNRGDATLQVFNTDGFDGCPHTPANGDEPTTGPWWYLKIKYANGFEIVRASAKTADTFTVHGRGVFGTDEVDHVLPAGSSATSGVEVEEYVYLEAPFPALVYAALTGRLLGTASTIPPSWSLGIPEALVDEPSFLNIGTDWYAPTGYVDSKLIFRFQNIDKVDGKRFIERELCLLAGAFLRVGADGKLGLRRMTGVIGSADFALEINSDNAIAHGPAKIDLTKIRNIYDISWSWVQFPGEDRARFIRRNLLLDGPSITLHGEQKPYPLAFKGLHNDRHTFTTLRNRFDALRDRYSGPPITLSVDLLPSLNDLEVGDTVRVNFPHIPDYTAGGPLLRTFEVQRLQVNQRSGRVTAQLFGSTQKAEPIADQDAGSTSELPDGWYVSGTEMGTILNIDAGGILQADGTLTGADATRTVFHYLGDFTIPAGRTLTIEANVELRIRGVFQCNGTLRVTNGNLTNVAGYFGITFGGPGWLVTGNDQQRPAIRVVGDNYYQVPTIEVENNAGVLEGIPADMRGSGGGQGGHVYNEESEGNFVPEAFGGAGGRGGGSVVIVSRGAGYGAGGETNLDGADGSAAGIGFGGRWPGSGGGGAPGVLVHLLDGRDVTFPILLGNVSARYGTSPIGNSEPSTQGKAQAATPIDLGVANARAFYVPASRTPYPDYENTEVGNQITQNFIFQRANVRPAVPVGNGIPAGWFDDPPGGGDPLWMSKADQTAGGTTIGQWSTPTRLDAAGGTSVLNIGRRCDRPEDWFANLSQTAPITEYEAFSVSGAPVFTTALRNSLAVGSTQLFSERVVFDPEKKYRASCWFHNVTGNQNHRFLLGVAFYDANGTHINAAAGDPGVNWPIVGSYHYYYDSSTGNLPTDWTYAEIYFGGDSRVQAPAAAAFMALVQLGNLNGTGTYEVQDHQMSQVPLDAVVSQLTNPAHTVSADPNGQNYNLFGAGGQHVLRIGGDIVTNEAVHSVVAPATSGGLTCSIDANTGVYTLSGPSNSWVTNVETFTLRATRNGVEYDQTYTICKARAGQDSGCQITSLTSVSLFDIGGGGPNWTVGYRLHSDGTIDTRGSHLSGYVNRETWIGACTNAEYECRMQYVSGQTPTGPALDTWLACSSIRTWELTTTGAARAFTGIFQIRRTSDDTILASVNINLTVEGNV